MPSAASYRRHCCNLRLHTATNRCPNPPSRLRFLTALPPPILHGRRRVAGGRLCGARGRTLARAPPPPHLHPLHHPYHRRGLLLLPFGPHPRRLQPPPGRPGAGRRRRRSPPRAPLHAPALRAHRRLLHLRHVGALQGGPPRRRRRALRRHARPRRGPRPRRPLPPPPHHLGLPSAARSVLLWMSGLGLHPSPIDYADLVFSFCRAGRLPDALQVLDEMRALGYPLNTHVYAPVLQAYCANADIQSADALIASMRLSGCHPDVVIYNIYIHGLCKAGDFYAVERVIEESGRNGCVPDTVTYSTYVAGLCRCGYVDAAFRQLEIMVANGLQLTSVGLNILLDHAAQELDMWVGKEVLERCEALGFEVDIVTYNTAMDHFCKKMKWLRVLKLFTDLLKKPITPDARTYNILISCLCRAGKFQLAKFVFGCKGFVADTVTCNILIHEFYGAGKEDELGFLFSDANAAKIVPDTITYNTLVDCLCRSGKRTEAANLVRHIDEGYPAEPVAHLTYWLVRSGHVREALRLFDDILAKGVPLDSRVFANVIKAFCRKGPVDCADMTQLCSVLDRMLGIG